MKLVLFTTAFILSTLSALADKVVWYDGEHPVTYQVVGKVSPVVQQAIQMFCEDMELVTGKRPIQGKKKMQRSEALPTTELQRSEALPTTATAIRIVEGNGNDDGFRISVQNGQVVVEGHNARGTAYGVLELSRMADVSPWVWWGDVRPHTRYYPISLPDTFCMEHTPSVEYRGIFINDEDWSLRQWSKDNMGPQTYKRLFQLMLRLRANTLWPAMHPGTPAFFTVPGNKEMADSFAIVIGTSHCEPLLRNNVAEWDTKDRGPYNYITNRDAVQQYWKERLQLVHGSDVFFTLGMRGIHDGSMEGVKTKEEKLAALQQVINDQRELIQDYYLNESHKTYRTYKTYKSYKPHKPHTTLASVPQVFIPYKEVLEIMDSGLRVPDDVTLMWCDDNYGYLTRLPDAEQQKRSGGGGVYYHLSYWGRPHDYLWLTTTQPGLIYEEMRTAYDHNCRKLWIANIHDPKVAAYQLELFLDMAWDINSVEFRVDSVEFATAQKSSAVANSTLYTLNSKLDNHLERWLVRQFGGQVGKAIFPAMRELYRLNAIRRPEFMGWTQVELDKQRYPGGKSVPDRTQFSLNEGYRRMEAFAHIEATVDTWRPLVMDARQDAYFAHVLYPVHASAAMTRKMLSNEQESRKAYEEIQQLTTRYNTMNDGKWSGLMSAAPRDLPVFGEVRTSFPQHPSIGKYIARNACEFDHCTSSCDGASCRVIDMLGHSMQAVALTKDNTLMYEFDSPQEGDAVLYTAMIPTQPNDLGDLRYTASIDDDNYIKRDTISMKTPYRSERWKQSVLRGQSLNKTRVHLTKGPHKLYIKALDDHIIADQWMIDFCPDREFYVIPAK